MLSIPREYIIAKIKQYAGNPVLKSGGNIWEASCPICREGKHWLLKKRMRYIIDKNYVYCHNCSQSWSPQKWIEAVTGMDFSEIKKDLEENQYSFYEKVVETPVKIIHEILPKNSINLCDIQQLSYYRTEPIIKIALKTILERRLTTAINSCSKYFLSLEDRVYRNRLIIPYWNLHQDLNYFTCRALISNQEPKYINKRGEKEIFNIHKIDQSLPYIFVFEGQIDAMFIKNGVAISGTTLTEHQSNLLKKYFPLHEIIYVWDNPHMDPTIKEKLLHSKKNDENRVFFYRGDFMAAKDFNEYCVNNKKDFIDPEYVIENSLNRNQLLLKL